MYTSCSPFDRHHGLLVCTCRYGNIVVALAQCCGSNTPQLEAALHQLQGAASPGENAQLLQMVKGIVSGSPPLMTWL